MAEGCIRNLGCLDLSKGIWAEPSSSELQDPQRILLPSGLDRLSVARGEVFSDNWLEQLDGSESADKICIRWKADIYTYIIFL